MEDVVTEATQVGELLQVLLQLDFRKPNFVQRCEEAKNVGIQGAGRVSKEN